MAREVIIKIIGDSKDVDRMIGQFKELGEVDEQNARTFKRNNDAFKRSQEQTLGTIEKMRLKEQALITARERSNNPKAIERYNRLLEKQRLELSNITNTTSKQVSSFEKIQGVLTNVGLAMSTAFAVQQIVQFGAELKTLAMQMEATNVKASIVFGDNLSMVTQKAKENANAIGLTTTEYIKAAASTQDLLVPLQFSREEASNMSVELTNLAGALAVWSGGQMDATQTAEVLTKAMLGEVEQLKQLGIQIDQSSPQFNNRIEKSMELEGITREQAKAMDILDQITSKSIDAQNSFANGQETMLTKSAVTNATLREQKEILATEMIPLWQTFDEVFAKITGNLAFNIKGVRAILSGGDSLMEDVKALGPAAKKTGDDLDDMPKQPINSINALKIKLSELQAEYEKTEIGSARFNELRGSIAKVTKQLDGMKEVVKPKESPLQLLQKQAKDLTDQLNLQALAGDISTNTLDAYLNVVKKLTDSQASLNVEMDIAKSRREGMNATIDSLELMEEKDTEVGQVIWDNEKARTKRAKDSADERVKIEEDANEKILQSAVGTVGNLQSTLSLYTQSRITAIDELVKAETISEEEGAKRKKELLREAAVQQKLFSIFDIILNTSQAVINAIANVPPPFGQILAGVNASLGAAQLGLVAATPIPAFKKGTKNKKGSGLSRVGEEGEELVFLPGGAKVLPNKQTMEHAGLIDAMFDNKLDDYILKSYLPKMLPQENKSTQNDKFINALTQNLGANGFSEDGIVNALRKLDKNEEVRLNKLADIIVKNSNKRVNLRG